MLYLHLVTLRTIEVHLIMQNFLSRLLLNEVLLNRYVIQVFSRPYCYNPLSVVVGHKLRLVLHLNRSVNPFVKNFKFKYEGLPTLAVMFRRFAVMFHL